MDGLDAAVFLQTWQHFDPEGGPVSGCEVLNADAGGPVSGCEVLNADGPVSGCEVLNADAGGPVSGCEVLNADADRPVSGCEVQVSLTSVRCSLDKGFIEDTELDGFLQHAWKTTGKQVESTTTHPGRVHHDTPR
ncbi:unnamed protein product [Boreogadus saida]